MRKYILPVVFVIALAGCFGISMYSRSLESDEAVVEKDAEEEETADAEWYVDADGTRYELVESIADFAMPEYEELKEQADVIAIVTVEEGLDEAIPSFTYDETGTYMYSYYQSRNVKVDKYYKNELGEGETLKVTEPCAVEEGRLITVEGYEREAVPVQVRRVGQADNSGGI